MTIGGERKEAVFFESVLNLYRMEWIKLLSDKLL